MLRAQFRFKRPEFRRLMSAMHLSDKFILLSRKGRAQYFPTDICMTILLRRVEYSSRFVDILLIFRLPSNRICDIFHVFLYLNFKQTLRLGGMNLRRQHEAANFLIYMCTCVNSNQFTEALRHPGPISLEEFMKMTA